MAGRSGAAAIESELREAASKFDCKTLAASVRKSNDQSHDEALASALEALSSTTPCFDRREGELLWELDDAADSAVRKVDCTSLCGLSGCGLEVQLSESRGVIVGVSLYLE
jgi:hypothetical protein